MRRIEQRRMGATRAREPRGGRRSRRFAASCLLLPLLAAPAAADLNNLYASVNGFATFLADPVVQAIDPPKTLKKLPGSTYTAPPLGFFLGTLQMVFRGSMAAMDLAVFPAWIFPVMGPEPRWALIEDVEYDY